MEQETAEKLKAQEPWRITDNELELYRAKVCHFLSGRTAVVTDESCECVCLCFRQTGRLDSTSCWRSIRAQPNLLSCKRHKNIYYYWSIIVVYAILWSGFKLFTFHKITQSLQTVMLITYSRNISQNGGAVMMWESCGNVKQQIDKTEVVIVKTSNFFSIVIATNVYINCEYGKSYLELISLCLFTGACP